MRKMKRISAILLVIAMVLTLLPMTAFAAGTDYKTRLLVDKVDETKVDIKWLVQTLNGAAIKTANSILFKFDNTKYEMITNSGEVITPISISNNLGDTYQTPDYEQDVTVWDTPNLWNTSGVYAEKKSNQTFVLISLMSNKANSKEYSTETPLSVIHLKLKSGTVSDGIPSNSIQIATKEEADSCVQSGVIIFIDAASQPYFYGNPDGPDTLIITPTVDAGTGVTLVKPALAGTPTIDKTDPKYGDLLTATHGISSTEPGTISYQWYRGSDTIENATGITYTVGADDIGKQIKVRVTAANYSSYIESASTAAVAKDDGPAAPTGLAEVSKTDTSITVTSNSAWEYTKDGGTTPQDSNVFSDLSPNTAYSIQARVKATETQKASDWCTAVNITTNKSAAGTPSVPTVAGKTDTTITVTAVAGQKYICKLASEAAPVAGDANWADVVEFTGLNRNKAYKIYTYIPESDTTKASEVVSTEVTTDKTAITDTLVHVSDLTGKTYTAGAQEPTFGGSLTPTTNYTVAYAVKSGTTGSLDANNKPLGAGTYTVTVSGAGDYTGSFEKELIIGKKEVTVTPNTGLNKEYGANEPDLTYTIDIPSTDPTYMPFMNCNVPLSRATGENVGDYLIGLGTYTAPSFNVKLDDTPVYLSITAKNVTDTRTASNQKVVKGVGDFTEPTFGEVTGTLAYSYSGETTYAGVKAKLDDLAKDDTGTIKWTYTANGNYTGTITGSINFTIVDIVFTVGGNPATVNNALTVKASPIYGDTWETIVAKNAETITAAVGENTDTDQSHFTLNVSGTPNAGDAQEYKLLYNGTINGVTYTNAVVCSGTVNVAPKTLTAADLEYSTGGKTKTYDGTTASAATLKVKDASLVKSTDTVTVPGSAAFNSADVATANKITFTTGAISTGNYALASGLLVDITEASITKATLTVEGTGTATADYGTKLKDITISGLTAKLNGNTVAGTWAFSGEDVLNVGNTTECTATFTPTTGAGNYNVSTKSITPTINKVDYSGNASKTINLIKNCSTKQSGTLAAADFFTTAPEGASIIAVSTRGTLLESLSVTGYTSIANITATADDVYTITIASTNYNNISATLTFHPVNKSAANVSFTGTVPTAKTYGNADFTLTAAAANVGTGTGVWTWTSSDPTVLKVTGTTSTATVKILKVGTATITAKYESDTTVDEATTGSITVGKATVTVAAVSRNIYVNGTVPNLTAPALGTDYTVTGLVGSDALVGTVTMKYQQSGIDATPDNAKVGTYDIVISGVTEPAGGNYNAVVLTNGTLTISANGGGGSIGGGGGSGETPSNKVSITNPTGGSVSANSANAEKGDTVTLTVKAEEGYELDTLTVKDSNGNAVALTKTSDNTYTFTMPDSEVTICSTFKKLAVQEVNPFTDVNADEYYYDAVLWAVDKGVTKGTTDTTFSPDLTCTRAETVTFLWRAMGCPEPTTTVNPFNDVSSDAYYYKAVLWAVENGITKGTAEKMFSPDDTVTRGQVATFQWRAAGSKTATAINPFADVASGDYYYNAVLWAVEQNITTGTTTTTFSPADGCTRGQIVTFLYRDIAK